MKNKKNISGTTIVESVIVMLIVVVGIIGTYSIYTKSQKLIITTQNRLIGTQIAREGIEAVMNIRDTNWKIFGANTTNCWMTQNYNSSCITDDDKNFLSGSYIAYIGVNNRWYLDGMTNGDLTFFQTAYRNNFKVNNLNGFYTQSGGTTTNNPFYTRQIKLTPTGTPPTKYKIESIVKWADSSRNSGNFEVKLETELTNWKK